MQFKPSKSDQKNELKKFEKLYHLLSKEKKKNQSHLHDSLFFFPLPVYLLWELRLVRSEIPSSLSPIFLSPSKNNSV